jgi:hypothetical protein
MERVVGRLSTGRCSGLSDLPHPTFGFEPLSADTRVVGNAYLISKVRFARYSG